MLGLLEMDRCYLNTQAQKDLVLEQAKKTFNAEIISKLDEILTVQHLGVKREDIIDDFRDTKEEYIIVFNHRPDTYKNYNHFVNLMRKLRVQRQDFTVWVPLLNGEMPEPYFTNEKFDKEGYYAKLRTCRVGFSPKQLYGGWSVSTTDGLMNGCPYIMYDAPYYRELNPTAHFFTSDEEALELLDYYLSFPQVRHFQSGRAREHLKQKLLYEDEIQKMSVYITDLVDRVPREISGSTQKMVDIIKSERVITKEDLCKSMNWFGSRRIKFTSYRKKLLTHPNIYDNISAIPNYIWRE